MDGAVGYDYNIIYIVSIYLAGIGYNFKPNDPKAMDVPTWPARQFDDGQ